jgi:hypothetical protein
MMSPTYRNLKATTSWWRPSVSICSGSRGPQGNPRFYKYYWRVFSLECPWEDGDFFKYASVLCNAACEKEVERLLQKRRSCMIYGFKLPRKDPGNPWDMTHARWANTAFALCWDEDTDPVVEGGHR